MKSLMSRLIGNSVLANLLMVTVLVAGAAAAFLMVREEMPNVSFDRIQIEVSFPGAAPEEVEEGITRKIEEAVRGMEGINLFRSVARENLSVTEIEVTDGYDGLEVMDRIRSRINAISTFPAGVEKPVITLPLHADPVMAIYLCGGMPEKSLKAWSYDIKDRLLALDQVSQVSLFGLRNDEINIEIPEKRLREYGLSFSQVADAVRRSNLNMSGGRISSKTDETRLRVLGRKYTDSELASIAVISSKSGELVPLEKIAEIKDGFEEDGVRLTVNENPAVIVSIYKTNEEDAIRIAQSVQDFIDRESQTLPTGVHIGVLFDNTNSIRHQINILVQNGIIGLGLVFLILWLFLNARLSFWTGMGILISIIGGVAVLWAMDGTFNMISIFGFVMILGIVADDAIVVGESIAWHRSRGKGPLQAAVDGLAEVGLPVLIAVLTTILAFIPLMFIDGMMGKLIRILPTVVIACLVLSLFESFVLLPAHLSHLPEPGAAKGRDSRLSRILNFVPGMMGNTMGFVEQRLYDPVLKVLLKWRYVFLCFCLGLLMITAGLVQGGFVKFDMLPERDGFYVTAVVEFPEGTSLEITENAVRTIEAAFLDIARQTRTGNSEPLARNIMSISGQAPDVEPGNLGAVGNHLGGVQVMLLEAEKRGVHTRAIVKKWKKAVGTIRGVRSLRFTGNIMGDPGKPIQIGVEGQSLKQVSMAVAALEEKLSGYEGVFGVQADNILGKDEAQFRLKPEAETLGITLRDLAEQLTGGYYGEEVLRVQRDREEVKIRVRYSDVERSNSSSLDRFMIRTSSGSEIPLGVVADMQIVPGSSDITRVNGRRRITVGADVDTSVIMADEVINDLTQSAFPQLMKQFPGVGIVLEGDAGESEKSFDTMFMGFIIAILVIYMMIAALFRSYLQPAVILFTIPFGIIGSVWGHLLMGWDLTMISMFGMVGLAGIVVNDAIVLIERINRNIQDGIPFMDAVRLGGVRRFRAVFLTSITTIGGLAPLVVESDSYATILVPMAITIVFGIAFSTVLTLVFIPCLLAILNDARLIFQFTKEGRVDRNEVEPPHNPSVVH